MNKILPLLILPVLVSNAAANAGPGPWANGAYYPGQLDGRYSANVYNNTQDRFDADEMDPPAGNRVFTNTFSVAPATTNPATTNPATTNPATIIPATTNTFLATNVTINVTNVDGITSTTSITNITTTSETNLAVTNLAVTNLAVTNLANSAPAHVVSGVLGFAVRNGTPSVAGLAGTSSSAQGNVVQSIGLDTSHNYFVVYVDGNVFAGQTAAGINLDTKRVNGSLWNGVGQPNFQLVTNSTITVDTNTVPPIRNTNSRTEILSVPGATAAGYFNAKIKSDKSPFVFKGAGEITTLGTLQGEDGSAVYPFNLDGIKSSENSLSAYGQTGRNAP